MLKRLICSYAVVLFMVAMPAQAQAKPDELVRTTTNELLVLLKKNHAVYKADLKKLYTMVYQQVLPHFDFKAMSKLVLGRNWRAANADQRERFADEFKDLLVRTYSTALLKYTDEEILFLPYRAQPDAKRVEVKTEVKLAAGGANIPLNYKFYRKTPESDWKIYDVVIDGVSMVTNYRSVYAEKIQKEGLDALITSLAANNTKQAKQGKL